MNSISKHIKDIKISSKKKQEYNAQANSVLRKGLWNMFQSCYKRINGREYDTKSNESLSNIGALLSYFTQSQKFLDAPALVKNLNNPSLEKGLLIIGGYGNGKTTSMESLNEIMTKYRFSQRFKMVNSRDMVQEYECIADAEEKQKFWDRYMVPVLCIDDVKKERQASNYGLSEIVGDVLVMRYNKGLKTHITCNYAEGDQSQDLKQGLLEFARYGEHFYDRIFEMFNIIEFKGKSLRN